MIRMNSFVQNIILLVCCCLFFTSCENVVDLDLDTATPKLVIEAAINWQKGTTGNKQQIQLSMTTGYYSDKIPVVSGAKVFITNSENVQFDFQEIPNTGTYVCNNFIPKINETYVLNIENKGEIYQATEILKSVAPISRIEQNNEGGFTGKDIEIKAFFNDPGNEDNFYLFHYVYLGDIISNYNTSEDSFYQGNEFFSLSQKDELEVGDKIQVTHFGISKQYYNYMNVLISASDGSANPFKSPPANARGNVVNKTNFDNYPYGYFSLSEMDTKEYTIQ